MVSNKFANLLKSLFNQNKRNSLKTIKSDNAVSSINSQISDKNINLHKKIKHHHHVEPLSNDAHSLNIYLGSDISGESYYWSPLSELNPHMLIVGVPGVGKTQTIKSIISSLNGYSNSVPTFAIDFENEYTDVIDFMSRLDGDIINKRQLEKLIQAGGFDSILEDRAILFNNITNFVQIFGNVQTDFNNQSNNDKWPPKN